MAEGEQQQADDTGSGGDGEPRYLTAEEILAVVPRRFGLRNRPVRLQALSAGQFDEMAADAVDESLTDREFVARFLARQAAEPPMEERDLADWSDDELLDALRQWVEQTDDDVDVESELSFDSFRAWARREAEDMRAQMQKIYDGMSAQLNLAESTRQFAQIAARLTPHIDRSVLDRMSSPLAQLQLEGVLGPSKALEDFTRQLGRTAVAGTWAHGPVIGPPYTGGGIPVGGPGAADEEGEERAARDEEDARQALQEAESARHRLAMDQVEAARELVDISKGQSANTIAVLTELKGMRGELRDSGHWSKWAALGAWASVAVGVAVIVITLWFGLTR